MSVSDPCNDHCASCPFACHSEVEDGHTPEWLLSMQYRVNTLLDPRSRVAYPQTFVLGVDQ